MATQIADIVSEQRLLESYRKHAALAQLNRMWLYQERPASGLANLLDMMAPNVVISSIHLDVRGHADLTEAMARIPVDWRAGHVLKEHKLEIGPGYANLSASIGYLTEGADGTVSTADADYGARFVEADCLLPKLARIEVTQGDGRPTEDSFIDMFALHRVRSAVHYFFALVENPGRDAEPFGELLANEFALHYRDEPIDTLAAVHAWVSGPLSSVVASEHELHSVTCREARAGYYEVEISMKSQALFPDCSGAISRNTQHWKMTDDIAERFPRIVDIQIDRDSVVRFDAQGRQIG